MRSTPTAEAILAGDRRALAKAITLVESRESDREAAQALLKDVLPHTGNSIRVGVTGVPGGSTLSRPLVNWSSNAGIGSRCWQSIRVHLSLADRFWATRPAWKSLAREEAAFIRPSPAGHALGGVAKTRESLMLCEAAGFDVILVETVGVGQSEHQVAGMVDFFLLLMLPGGGDELQGIKKGILELADAIVVNKADGASEALANTTQQQYKGAMSLWKHDEFWQPRVMTCSALHGSGVEAVWDTIEEYTAQPEQAGILMMLASQNLWMHQLVDELLWNQLARHPRVRSAMPDIESAVRNPSRPRSQRRSRSSGCHKSFSPAWRSIWRE